MKILQEITSKYRYWFLKQAFKKNIREKKILGYGQAVNFGIIYDASTEEAYRDITKLVKDLQYDQKKVKTLGFVNQKKMPDHAFPKLTFEFCNAQNFSITQKPITPNIIDFAANNFDILIDLTPSTCHQVKYLAAISDSTMKVGRYVEKYVDIFDLMLQLEDEGPLQEAIEQVFYYLKMINNDR